MEVTLAIIFIIVVVVLIAKRKKPSIQENLSEDKPYHSSLTGNNYSSLEEMYLSELEGMDKKSAKEWFRENDDGFGSIPAKAYAKYSAIIEGRKWLSDDEFDKQIQQEIV